MRLLELLSRIGCLFGFALHFVHIRIREL